MAVRSKGFIGGAVLGAGVAGAALAGIGLSWPAAVADQPVTPPAASGGQAYSPPAGAPMSFAGIIERVSPAVVSIRATGRVTRAQLNQQFGGLPFGLGPNGPQQVEPEDLPEATSAGSGFFIRPDGYIVTNNHVIEGASEVTVVLNDQREFTARVIGRDEGTDLAVLKIDAANVPYATFATGPEPRVGDWVVAVGNPFGLGGTVTAGIVSAFGRDLPQSGPTSFTDFIQIDAPINRGNSGGPTFDLNGRVIGVNTAIFSDLPNGGSVGIGFAIPANIADRVTQQLIRGGRVVRGYLGATVQTLPREAAEGYGLGADTRGAVISEVTPGGPAQRAGLQAGDVILSFNGERVESNSDLTRRVAGTTAGEAMRLEVFRGGRRQVVEARAGTRPTEQEIERLTAGQTPGEEPTPGKPEEAPLPQGVSAAGITVAPLDAGLRARFSIDPNVNGLVITEVQRGLRGLAAGLQPGMVMLQINGRAPAAAADWSRAVEEARRAGRNSVALLVRAGRQNTAIGVRIDQPAPSTPAPAAR